MVVEAGDGSGALHTANWAREQDRDVFAIPGQVFSKQNLGTNQSIRESTARLVSTPQQLLEEMNLTGARGQIRLPAFGATGAQETDAAPETAPAATEPPTETTTEKGQVLHWLGPKSSHVDELVRTSGLAPQTVSSTLQMLELKGLVREESPMVYRKASSPPSG